MIFAIVNTKGGVGKTTTAVHLATMLARKEKTLLIDGDPQETAASWAAWRRDQQSDDDLKSPTTIRLTGKAIYDEGKKLSSDFENIVIDAGGRDSSSLRSALLLAERAIIPIGASNFDAAAITDLLTIVDLAKDFNPLLDVRFLLTRIDPRTKDASDMLSFLGEQKLSVISTKVCERVAFRRTTGEGCIVHEIGKDLAAIAEMDSFFKEVMQ